jgi:hypothetical protein
VADVIRTLVLVAVIASCKDGDRSGASSSDPTSGSPSSGSPSPGLAVYREENSAPYAAGSRAVCNYRKDGDTTNLGVTLIIECSNLDAKAEYAGLKKAVGSIDTMEDLPGLGDEAWWVTRGAIKARKGPIIIDVVLDYYHIDGKTPAAAKERAIEMAKRLFAAAP